MRMLLAGAVVLLGVGLGVYELVQQHWFAGLGYLFSAMLTGGLILIGSAFVKESFIGAGLALLTAVTGFYGFFFENRAFDVALDQARFEAAMALASPEAPCAIADASVRFQQATRACFLQANRDKMAAVGEAARQAYAPPGLDLADKLLASAQGEAPDGCQEQFAALHAACPTAFASMDSDSVRRLTAPR